MVHASCLGMNTQKFTEMSLQAIQDSQSYAQSAGNTEVDTFHLLKALIEQEHGIVPELLSRMSLSANMLSLALDRELEKLPKTTGNVDTSKVYVTQVMNQVLTEAEKEVSQLKDEFISV
ncbi:uncharacterized protein METZ01_LOCUS473248, partial [marine metagenome]